MESIVIIEGSWIFIWDGFYDPCGFAIKLQFIPDSISIYESLNYSFLYFWIIGKALDKLSIIGKALSIIFRPVKAKVSQS